MQIAKRRMYKGHSIITDFNKVRLALSEEHRTSDLRAVNSNPTVGRNFSFSILSISTRTWHLDWSRTNESKHDVHVKYIEIKHLKRMTALLVPSTRKFKGVHNSFKINDSNIRYFCLWGVVGVISYKIVCHDGLLLGKCSQHHKGATTSY